MNRVRIEKVALTASFVVFVALLLLIVAAIVFDGERCEPPKKLENRCYYTTHSGKVSVKHEVHCLDTRAEHVMQVCR